MPTGSPRPNGGPPLGSRNNPHGRRGKPKAEPAPSANEQPRPRFQSGRDFALWAINASDIETPMEVKVRAMQALISLEAKAVAEPPKKPAAQDDGAGLYAPRKVRGFGVVNGGR